MKHLCATLKAVPKALGAASLALALCGVGGEAQSAVPTFAAGKASGQTGTQVLVPVTVTNFTSISAFQFSWHWSTNAATFVSIEPVYGIPGMGAASFGTTLTATGTVTVSWDDLSGLSVTVPDGTTAFTVRLQLTGTPGTSSALTIDGEPTPMEAADESLNTISITPVAGMLTINPLDMAPSITMQPQNQTVGVGGSATFNVTATGTMPMSYQWRRNGANLTGQTSTSLALNNVQSSQAGDYTVVITNRIGAVTSDVARLIVILPNTPPVLGSIGNRTIGELASWSFTASATDTDAPPQSLTFSIDPDPPVGLTIHPTTGLFSWTPQEIHGPGTYNVTVRVTDNGSPPLSDTETITIIVNEVNTAPSLAAISDRSINEGSQLSLIATATDGDLPPNNLIYSLDPGAPGGAAIQSSSGLFTWTPTEAQGPGVYSVTVRVSDGGSPAFSDTKTFSITVGEVNSAPVLPSPGNRVVAEGATLAFNGNATDSDAPLQTLTYSLDATAPAGAVVHPATGAFSWTPTEAQGPGTNIVTMRVIDNGSPALSDFKVFVIVVTEVNTAPVLAPLADKTVVEGNPVICTNSATDSDLPSQALTYSLGPGAPAGATVHPTTGLFSWTPGEPDGPGTNRISIVVTDNAMISQSATQSFTIVVLESNRPPVLQTLPDFTAQVLVPLRITNVVEDPDLPTNQITFQFLEAPKGARLNKFTGVIFWSPSRDQARTTNNFTVIAFDDAAPPQYSTNSFQVSVDDFLEMMLGAAVLRSGDTASVPIDMFSTIGVTNIEAVVFAPQDRISGLQLLTIASELRPAALQMEGPGTARLTFDTQAGQSLVSSQLLAHLRFTGVSTQSAFVPITLSAITAQQTNGLPVPRTIANNGRVVVVAEEPLLEALVMTNHQRQLVLYGPPGQDYIIESSSQLGASQWQTAWQGTMSNLYRVIVPAQQTNSMFFRAIRQ